VEALDPRSLLSEAEGLQRQARADRHAASVPLLVFGVLTLASAVFMAVWR
jgi:hypothetical protein